MTDRGIESTVSRLSGTAVLIVGDLMLDEYIWGDVRRISPEAPVPVVEVAGLTAVPGGAANAAAGIVALGGQARLGGVVGGDASGQRLRARLRERGIAVDGIWSDERRPTTTKTRIVAGSQQVVRADRETCAPLAESIEDALGDWALGQLGGAGAVILSDYAKGAVSARLAQTLIEAASARRLPVVVDTKGVDYARYRGATVLTPNLEEAARASGLVIADEEDLCRAAKVLLGNLGGAALLVTRGAQGMTLFTADGPGADPAHIQATARNVFDVTGAGDTVVASLALALASGASLPDAAHLASAAAGVVVGKVGTATVSLAELAAAGSPGGEGLAPPAPSGAGDPPGRISRASDGRPGTARSARSAPGAVGASPA